MHRLDVGCFVHAFFLFRFVRWYACHSYLCHPLAFYASLHTCLHVHAWVLLASVLSILQHNEFMDIRSHLILADTTFCLLSCLFAYFLACLLAFLFLCLSCLSCLSILCLLRMHFAFFPSIAFMLVSCLCLCMYTHGAMTYGVRAQSLKRKQKGRRCKHVDMSQVATFS